MSGYVTCFCGLDYTFGGDDGHCPNCGTRASLKPDAHFLSPEEEGQVRKDYADWLASLPTHEGS